MTVNNKVTNMSASAKTTHVRAAKTAPRRISRLGRKLEQARGGEWPGPKVLDEALGSLERELAKLTEVVNP